MAKRVNQALEAESEPESGVPSRNGGPAGSRPALSRRDEIFAAALRLFRERGFHGTAINDIGAAAGVTGPALYRHFSGKDDVLAEAIRSGARRIADATREALADSSLAPAEALEALVRSYVRVAVEDADFNATYVLESRHLPDALRGPIRRDERAFRREWQRLLLGARKDLSEDEAATLVNMAVFSVAGLCMVPSRLEAGALVDLATRQVMAMLLVMDEGVR